MDALVFRTHVEVFPAPPLRARQIVAMYNLGAHKGERISELVQEDGCELLYLPNYSPYLRPIEEAFAKIEAIPRKAEARAREILIEPLGRAISAVRSQGSHGFFKHRGYWSAGQTFAAFGALRSTAKLCCESFPAPTSTNMMSIGSMLQKNIAKHPTRNSKGPDAKVSASGPRCPPLREVVCRLF